MSSPGRVLEPARLARVGLAAATAAVVLAMYPRTIDPTGPIKILIYQWSAVVLTGIAFVGGWLARRPFRVPRVFFGVLLPFTVLLALSAVFSDHRGASLAEAGKFASLFLLYLAASQAFDTPAQVRRYMLATCGAVALATAYGFVQHWGLDPFPFARSGEEMHRSMPATLGHPNYAAHLLVLAIVFGVCLATRRATVWAWALVALYLAHLRITGARGGVVALAAAAVLLGVAWLVSRRVRRPVPAAVVSVSVAAVLGAAALLGALAITQARTGNPFPLDASLLLRYNSYFGASRMILAHPMKGYGPGNYEVENPAYWTPYEQRWFAENTLMNQHVHNDFLEAGVDAGLPGAALYMAFVLFGVGYGLVMAFGAEDAERRRLGYAFAALFTAFGVDSAFGFNLRVPASAVAIFVSAGMLDGLWSSRGTAAPVRRSLGTAAWRVAVVAVSVGIAVFGTRMFEAEQMMYLGRAAKQAGYYAEADKTFARGETLAPWDWEFARERGLVARYTGNSRKAMEHLEEAVQRNPQSVLAWLGLAEMRMNVAVELFAATRDAEAPAKGMQMLERAKEAARRTIELCPPVPDAEDALGRITAVEAMQLQQQQVDLEANRAQRLAVWTEAEEHFERALELGAKNRSKLYEMIAQARIARDDIDGAEAAFVRAVQAESGSEARMQSWQGFLRFARTFERFEAFRSALDRQLARALSEEPRNRAMEARLYGVLADALQAQKADAAEVEMAYREALARAPQDDRLWEGYALLAKSAGRTEAFRQAALETVDRLRKEKRPVPASLASVEMIWRPGGAGVSAAAENLLKAVGEKDARPASARLTSYAWAIDAVLTELRRPETPPEMRGRGLVMLGEALLQLNQGTMAMQAFQEALTVLPDGERQQLERRMAQLKGN